ncbi:type IV conjugative transfer system coupling protein TraD [Pantoea sp. App145]|uniref:type IV conjugative transfer system coupling protein TraD n=1 Tax=Pantoea sp. App145 TaxID=3071567 RepID=UPI003A811823
MSLNARDFTQGGQVMKYMIGMFLQIMNIASYWVVLFSVLVFLSWMLLRLTLQEFIHGSAYWLIKWFVIPLQALSGRASGGSWTFHFKRTNGDVVAFRRTAAEVMSDPYFVQMGEQVSDAAFYGWGLATFSFLGAFLGITWFLGRKGAKQRESEITGGRVLARNVREVNQLLEKAGMQSLLKICGLHLLKDSEMQNLGLHGTVGTGKSTVLNDLLMQLRKRGDRVIIYDKGNNFIPLFYRQDKDKILNPFDARCAPWDLWAECQSVADFDNFATTLLPDSGGGSDPFWVLSARALFVATARRVAKDKDRNIASLLKKLMSISMVDLRAYLQGTDAANLVEGSIEKTAMTIRTILTTYVRSLRYLQGLDEQGHRPFNIRDWLATEDADGDNPWIFVSSDGRHHAAITPLLSAWLHMTMTSILGLTASRSRRIWVVLDEIHTLHRQPVMPEFCAEGRKFGACIIAGVQNFPQLKEQFGANFAESIWDLLNTRIFYRAPSGTVAEWVRNEIGECRHKKFRDQYSYGIDIIRDGVQFSKDEVNEYLVSYSDVQKLNDLECYVTLPGDWPAVRMKLRRREYRVIAEGRIDRSVEDLFDPELETQLAGGFNDVPINNLVTKVFDGTAVTAASEEADGRDNSTLPPVPTPVPVQESDQPLPSEQATPPAYMQPIEDLKHHAHQPDSWDRF